MGAYGHVQALWAQRPLPALALDCTLQQLQSLCVRELGDIRICGIFALTQRFPAMSNMNVTSQQVCRRHSLL